MNIAICDDTPQERERIVQMLSEYTGAPLNIQVFENGISLLETVQTGNTFDVVLLDIIMPGMSGMETARNLRRYATDLILIFFTTSLDYAIEGYEVAAKRYLIKPVQKEELFALLNEIVRDMNPNRRLLPIKTASGLNRLDVEDVIYCEVIQHSVHYHMRNGRVYIERSSMAKLETALLRHDAFIKPHRSYIVNMNYICSVDAVRHVIELQWGGQIPIAKARRGGIAEKVAAWFEKNSNRRIE